MSQSVLLMCKKTIILDYYMNRIILLLSLVLSAMTAHAQLPRWVVPPILDSINVKVDGALFESKSGKETSLWTMDGERLYTTSLRILPFQDGVATVFSPESNTLSGFVDLSGNFTPLGDMIPAYGRTSFEDGYILGFEKEKYIRYDRTGKRTVYDSKTKHPFPFSDGYAPLINIAESGKAKDSFYSYEKADGSEIEYKYIQGDKTKEIELSQIRFLSGVNKDVKGVAVIKDKLYLFSPETELFEPFLWGDEESEKKRHLTLQGSYDQYFLNPPTDSVVITAKYGNNQIATLNFDSALMPVSFDFDGELITFKKPSDSRTVYETSLSTYGNRPYGLSMDGTKVLPEQFEDVGLMYGNRALVRKDGKWGIIEIIPTLGYSVRINKGEDIAFRHRKFETQIRLDLPSVISAKDAKIDIPEKSKCEIDRTSRETKDTESGNFVTYHCTLYIPESLPDTITPIVYEPVKVSYDGISLFDSSLSVNAWHLKHYNVDPIDSETTIEKGVATFTININTQRIAGEGDFSFELLFEAEDVAVEYEKLSETRYKLVVSNLQEGNNNLSILVKEKDCPASVFPFEIFYTKPVPRKKEKEAVLIRKKQPAVPDMLLDV